MSGVFPFPALCLLVVIAKEDLIKFSVALLRQN